MKLLFFIIGFSLFASVNPGCKTKKESIATDTCFKGKLEIKANCMNYTISIQQGTMDTSLYVSSWTNESTGTTYKNVFGLASKCNFPTNINEGDEFYFMIDSTTEQGCAVCLLYYPVPEKKLGIRVIQDPCTE